MHLLLLLLLFLLLLPSNKRAMADGEQAAGPEHDVNIYNAARQQ